MDNFYATYSGLGSGSGGVTTLNSLSGALTLVAGSGITITPAGSNITIDATGGGGITNPLLNSVYLKWRNFANNTDLNVLTVDAADAITIGTNSSPFPGFMNIFTGTSPGGNIDVQTDTMTLYGNTTNAVQIRLYAADQSFLAAIRAPATLAADYILTLPPDDGDAGQFLQTDGSGILSWAGAATTALDNLADVAINTDLIFSAGIEGLLKTHNTLSNGDDVTTMTISAGSAAGVDTNGGDVSIISGSATGTASDIELSDSGNVNITTNTSVHGNTGDTYLLTGDSAVNGRTSGLILIKTGNRTGTVGDFADSGEIDILTGDSDFGGTGGIIIRSGAGGAGAGSGSVFLISGNTAGASATGGAYMRTGDSTSGNTGELRITTGSAATGTGLSGDMVIETGVAAGLSTGSINLGTGTNQGAGDAADSGTLQLFSGNVDPTGDGNQSGFINIFSGNAPGVTNQVSGGISIRSGSSGYQSGEVLISSGDGTTADSGFSGGTTIATGDVTGTAQSGDVVLSPGTVDTGPRGKVDIRSRIQLEATNTAGGTTGAQTINKPSGTVNFATSVVPSTLVVTNNMVTANSLVFTCVRTAGTGAVVTSCVPTSGSFTITLAANTSETSVGFLVINQ